jgi:hypothetical protein
MNHYKLPICSEKFLRKYGIQKKYDFFEILIPYYYITKDLNIKINKSIDGINLNHAQIVMYSHNYNEPFDANIIPSSVKVLIFGNQFNQCLDDLPTHIEVLIFPNYSDFNCKLDNLPVNLKAVIFGKNYNQPLNLLPSSIIFIEFPLYSQYSTIIFPPYI